jgi:hypothetical protein
LKVNLKKLLNALLDGSKLDPNSAAYAQLKDKLDKFLGKGSTLQ